MAKFAVPLEIIVDAPDSSAAFADVRTHFCVVRDPESNIGSPEFDVYDFEIGDEPYAVDDDEDDDDI